jgi:hypothetical protein
MKGRLQDSSMYPPLVDLSRNQTFTQKIVKQPVEAYLLRVLYTA